MPDATTIHWGILGPGHIANKFAEGLQVVPGAQLTAVASRSLEKATQFAKTFSAPKAYGNYSELLADETVQAVYIATPHTGHAELALAALAAGKAVLCEKPMAVNEAQVTEIVQAARTHQVFCMEAMWTRFLPIMAQVREWIDASAIGRIRMVRADFGFRAGWNPDHRLLNPELAGGSLLDVGIYPLAFALWALGEHPTDLKACGTIGETGVDEQAALTLAFASGALAILDCAVRTQTNHTAEIHGTEGSIFIDAPFWRGTKARLRTGDDEIVIEKPFLANGYEYEAMEVGRCIRARLLESDTVTLDESLRIVRLLDEARRQIGVIYPFE